MGVPASFDRKLRSDLDRHLDFVVPAVSPEGPAYDGRPNVAVLIDAISNAARSLTEKDERISSLEGRLNEFEDLCGRMKSKLEELLRLHHSTSAFAKVETDRADRAEASFKAIQARLSNLEEDHEAALTDLHRIADVITASSFFAIRE